MSLRHHARVGQVVRTIAGEKLGRIVTTARDGFTIEKGYLFPHELFCRFEDIADVRDGEVFLGRSKEELTLGVGQTRRAASEVRPG